MRNRSTWSLVLFTVAVALGATSARAENPIAVIETNFGDITVEEITRRWRAATGTIVGLEELSFTSSIMSAGTPLLIELSGDDLSRLGEAASAVRELLVTYPGVQDATASFRGGPRELEIGPA